MIFNVVRSPAFLYFLPKPEQKETSKYTHYQRAKQFNKPT